MTIMTDSRLQELKDRVLKARQKVIELGWFGEPKMTVDSILELFLAMIFILEDLEKRDESKSGK